MNSSPNSNRVTKDGLRPPRADGPTDNMKLAIIAYARARPCIWNTDGQYTQEERDAAWRSFAEGFRLPVSELRKRWEGMRQVYRQELMEFVARGAVSKWSFFDKLDEFLRTPMMRSMEKEGTIPKEASTSQGEDIEYINLSSDSDGESKKSDAALPSTKQADHSGKAKAPESVIKLQTAEDVRNELRRLPPVTSSSGVLNKMTSSSIKPHQTVSTGSNRPRVGLKKRKSLPNIPDAKRRLMKNCGELIALKKTESSDALSKSLPLGNTARIGSPPHKMFGSSTNFAPSHRALNPNMDRTKSLMKKVKRSLGANHGTLPKRKKSCAPPESASSSGMGASEASSSEAMKRLTSEVDKLPKGTDITVSSNASKATVHLVPSQEAVTLHSVPCVSKDDQLATRDGDTSRGQRKAKKKKRALKDARSIKTQEKDDLTSDLIVLDNSDTEAPAGEAKPQPGSQQNGLDHDMADDHGAESDLLGVWRDELKDLKTTSESDSKSEDTKDEENDIEAIREMRKNFLLSFLPDMAEMTIEQRRFFKSKLMYLVCNIDQFP